jgi:serine/threonine protein kinase
MTSGTADVVSQAPVAGTTLIGRVVCGKYKVTALIGTGGMGRVYRAEQIPLGRTVALKTLATAAHLTPDGAKSSAVQFKERFFREARVLSQLQHPNVVTVFDYGKIDGNSASEDEYYMAMEFLVGETLLQRLKARGRFPADEGIHYLREAAQGLSAAHSAGVVHRDLKPSNLMIVKGDPGECKLGTVKILDFGIIKILNVETPEVTLEGSFVGSPRYMAPEQIVGGTVDVRADIYSLGVIAYQLLTGQTPFNGDTAVQTMMAHVNLPVPPMRSICAELVVEDWLEQLVDRCLEKDPAARPGCIGEVLEVLRTGRAPSLGNLRSGKGAADRRAEAEPQVAYPVPETKRSSSKWGAAMLLGAAGVVGVSWLAIRPNHALHPQSAASAPPVSDEFDLLIDSIPSGATVTENGRTWGITPVHVPVSNASVGTEQRRFTLELSGYQTSSVSQGPSNRAVIVRPALEPVPAPVVSASSLPPAPSPKTPTQGWRYPSVSKTSAPQQPAAPRTPLEIVRTR